MAAAVSAGAALVGAICQSRTVLWAPIADTIASSNDMEEIFTALKEAVEMLGAKREDDLAPDLGQKMKMLTKTYGQWIGKVIKTEEEVKKLLAEYDEQSKSSPTCFLSRSEFSNRMKKKGEKVIKLLEERNQLGIIWVDRPPEPVFEWEAPNIEKFSTLQTPLEETLNLLKDDKFKRISLSGLIGTGKTAIMKNLKNHEEVAKRFDVVIWIDVSTGETKENLHMSQLQNKIAKSLKVDMAGTSDSDDIAERISNELKGKKYLLLLNDVKTNLDIHQMGIPPCENGSKIVLTTREDRIHFPRVDRVVKVNPLTLKESFRMFQEVANCSELKKDRKAEACAWKIIKECGGLPILINLIARVFRMKDLKLWSEGFKSLKNFSEKGQHDLKELRNVIEFCYDDLEETQRQCLLYGLLYPKEIGIYIDCLLECWKAEDILGNGDDSSMAYIDGLHMLNHLKNKSLLEEDESQKYVKMHKCIRQVLLYILSDDPNCKLLVQQTPPDEECWSEKVWISLIENEFAKLPDIPNCGSLSTLFLQKNLALKSIPSKFFEYMTSLKVLDLCHTGIKLLPSSLSNVTGLKVLYLNYCEFLKELPSSLEKLQHLEVLDIRGSGFNNIPSDIGNLKGLKRFRVSFTKCGNEHDTREVEQNCKVISELSKLEELVIDVKSPRHQSNKVVLNVIKNVVTLEKLTRLQFCFSGDEIVDVIEARNPDTELRIHVPEADILYTFIEKTRSWRNIQHIHSFQFFIDCPDSKYPCIPKFSKKYERYVRYCNDEGINHPILMVLPNVDAFDLVNKKDIKQLSDSGFPSMKEVKGCQIESCSALETAVDSVILPNLEHLYMKDLPNLQSIWKEGEDAAFLNKLKTLVLSSCQMLEIIFPSVVIQHLCKIECLTIEGCSKIVKVVEKFTTDGNQDLLPKLKKLVLRGLPNLKAICADETSKWPAIMKLEILNCPALRKLPIKDTKELKKLILVDMPKLDSICSNESPEWPALIWLNIHKCPALNNMPFSQVNLAKLEFKNIDP